MHMTILRPTDHAISINNPQNKDIAPDSYDLEINSQNARLRKGADCAGIDKLRDAGFAAHVF